MELIKFLEKNPKNLVDRKAAWCYLLKESGSMSMKEAQILAETGEDMKQATDHLIQLSKDEKAMLMRRVCLGRRRIACPLRTMSVKKACRKALSKVLKGEA